MNMRASSQLSKKPSGATLVEVVITVGMLISMLLPLIGMLSLAVKNSGQNINTSVSSRIASQLIGEVQQADWQTLSRWDKKDFHFNDQGVALKANEVATQSNYIARVILDPDPVSVSTTGSAPANPHQKKFLILVSSQGGDQGLDRLTRAETAIRDNTPLPNQVHVSHAYVVNMQKDL